MRTTLLLVFLLGAPWLAGQIPAAPDQAGNSHQTYPEGSEQTVTGCLSHANGDYMLTRKDGLTFRLSRDASKLSDYVGQQVRVTGMVVAKSGTNGTEDAGGTGGTVVTLRVNSVKHIANTCPSGQGEMMPK
jgi:hypothetical protein